ncbi:unnamed protein product [Sympodiomycopsis kandeliae]
MKYLLQAIESRRSDVQLSDAELTKLLTDVQRARDDRSLLLDALERLVHDLRSQSHSAAFLARVNKRDAPDYYDVIKNPMDLGLMLKNVKSGKYRSTEAFRKDLDLIWDNCLAYNTEPSHPLRISAELMRQRSRMLLSYIQDSNDVKSTLSEWLATNTSLSAAETKKLQSKDATSFIASGHNTSSAPSSDPIEPQPITTTPNGTEVVPAASKSDLSVLEEEEASPDGTFENRKAITIASGADLAAADIKERRRAAHDEMILHSYLDSTATTSHRRHQVDAADGEESVTKLVYDLSRGQSRHSAGPSLVGLLAQNSDVQVNGLPPSDGSSTQAEASFAEKIACPLPRLPHFQQPPVSQLPLPPRHGITRNGGLGKRSQPHPMPGAAFDDDPVSSHPKRRKAVKQMKGNIAKIKRMRRLRTKFDMLDHCLEHEEPIPTGLLVESEDEEDGENNKKGAANGSTPFGQTGYMGGRSHFWTSRGTPPPATQSADSRIRPEQARSALTERIALLLGNAGFSGAQVRPTHVLTSITETFIGSLGRTLRMYSDRYGAAMSPEEIILHTLHATSSMGVRELNKYLHEDTPRAQSRLDELKRKLEASWKERAVVGEERQVTEEDARYFGEESDDLVAGNLPSAFDDDFFGFKAIGLDQELGMANLSVPSRLMRPRALRPRAGVAQIKEEQEDMFQPPVPFIRITEAAIPAQIGILQSFYRDLLHRRGYRVGQRNESGDGNDAEGDGDAVDSTQPDVQAQNTEDEGEVEGMLILPDQDQERPSRYKVPPNGKLPVRDFWNAAPAPSSTVQPAIPQTKNAPATNGKGAATASKGGKATPAAKATAGRTKKGGKKG